LLIKEPEIFVVIPSDYQHNSCWPQI